METKQKSQLLTLASPDDTIRSIAMRVLVGITVSTIARKEFTAASHYTSFNSI
jgi:hypothetical protein